MATLEDGRVAHTLDTIISHLLSFSKSNFASLHSDSTQRVSPCAHRPASLSSSSSSSSFTFFLFYFFFSFPFIPYFSPEPCELCFTFSVALARARLPVHSLTFPSRSLLPLQHLRRGAVEWSAPSYPLLHPDRGAYQSCIGLYYIIMIVPVNKAIGVNLPPLFSLFSSIFLSFRVYNVGAL